MRDKGDLYHEILQALNADPRGLSDETIAAFRESIDGDDEELDPRKLASTVDFFGGGGRTVRSSSPPRRAMTKAEEDRLDKLTPRQLADEAFPPRFP